MASLQTLSVPPDVKQLLSHHHSEAGFSTSSGYAWAFSRSQLAVWEPDSPAAQPFSHRLPYASSSVRHYVCIIRDRAPGKLAVLLLSEDGNATLWPDFSNPAAPEPLASRVPGRVAALAAAGAGGDVLAAAGMADGSVQLLIEGTGPEPTWVPLQPVAAARQSSSSPAAAQGGGMFGMLGSVLRPRQAGAQQAQQEAAEGPTPSTQPVVGLRFRPHAAAGQQLLVLRRDCLECWQVEGGGRGRLLRSEQVAQELEAAVGQGPVTLLGLASMPHPAQPTPLPAAALLASCPGGLFLATLAADGWGVEGCHHVGDAPSGKAPALRAAVAASGGACYALLWEEGGAAMRLDLGSGKGSALSDLKAPVLAASAARGGTSWLLLDSAGSLHHLAASSSGRAAASAGTGEGAAAPRRVGAGGSAVHVDTGRGAEPAAMAAGAAGARSADAVFVVLNAACQGQLGVASMAQQLASLGAFRGVGAANPIAKFSRHVLDTLPKRFGSGGETVGDQLQGKLALHNVLLQCLSDGGCLAQLQPATLRAVFEDGQRLRALMDLRELESKLQEQEGRRGAEAEGLPFPLHEVAVAAGRRCMGHVLGGGDRTPWEVFYACPSVTLSAFFGEVAEVAEGLGSAPGAAAQQLDCLAQLAKAAQVCLGGASQQRSQYQQWFPHPASTAAAGVDEPEWIVGGEVRRALQALAEACLRLYPLLSREAPSRLAEVVSLSFDLTERLLNAYAAALAAVSAAKRRGLQAEYQSVRDALLGHLLSHAQARCRAGAEGEGLGLVQRVESLAEAHAVYSLLFDICEFLGDRERLYELMTNLTGDDLTEPMAVYVFQRLLDEGRRSDLLDLPPQFDPDLAAWLCDESAPDAGKRLQIRWLHDLRIGDYEGAALSMSRLVASQPHSVRGAQRLAALDKLSAWAASPGWPAGVGGTMAEVAQEADAKLALLQLQSRMDSDPAAPALLDARSLMEAALEGGRDPAAAQVALQAYAAADRSFQQQHRGVLSAAWHRLAGASPWEALAQSRQGSTEEQFKAQVAGTPLFAAAAACYGGGDGGGALSGVVPPEEVYAMVDEAGNKLSPAGRELMLAAFQAGCLATAPGVGGGSAEEAMAMDL